MLTTLITIMLISHLIIGSLIFLNWFAYAESASKDILIKLDEDIVKGLGNHIDNNRLDMNKSIDTYLSNTIAVKNRIALVIDKDSGDLVGNSLEIDNFSNSQDGSKSKVNISDIDYPALSKAYDSYLETNDSLHKEKNNDSKFHVHISEYQTDEFNWLVLTALPDTQLTSSIVDNITHTVIIAIIGLSIALIIYLYIIKKLFKPAVKLLSTIESFSKGDLSKRTEIVRNDEIGIATEAFNNMADTIYELVNNLEDKVGERTLELEVANEIMKDNRNHLRLILDSTGEAYH